jgi:hypothetical protein
MGVDQNGHLALYLLGEDLVRPTSPPFYHSESSYTLAEPGNTSFSVQVCLLGSNSHETRHLQQSKFAGARAGMRSVDLQVLIRLRSPHGHVISSYQPQAITS